MNQAGGLLSLGEEHAQTGVSIAFLFTRHLEAVLLVAGIRAHPAQVAAKTRRSPDGSEQIQIARASGADDADILEAVEEAAGIAKPFLQTLQLRRRRRRRRATGRGRPARSKSRRSPPGVFSPNR